MKELSIFVDESGDFGELSKHSPYYLLTLVFHDQSNKLGFDDFKILDTKLEHYFPDINETYVHSGPLIRKEDEYAHMDLPERRHIINSLLTFAYKAPINYKTIVIEKRHTNDDPLWLHTTITKELNRIIDNHLEWFLSYDAIKIYYDRGQKEITTILNTVFHSRFDNANMKERDKGFKKYRLHQIADLICTLELLNKKFETKSFNKAEIYFFENHRNFYRNYYKMISKKKIKN